MTVTISAEIQNVEYTPLLCKDLPEYEMHDIRSGTAFSDSSFKLNLDNDETVGVSWWVTPKRTRSYPYTRVYDTMDLPNRITIIPIVKDEGSDGDRDYLGWTTVSFMSLLGVYVVPAYYTDAEKNEDYENKITNQEFDYEYISRKIKEHESYQSDALHWNMKEMENLEEIGETCEKKYYEEISPETGVKMHSREYMKRKIRKMTESVERFKNSSREESKEAQRRELETDQPKENVIHEKGEINLTNFLGGEYNLTTDELQIIDDNVILIEKKHTRRTLPSMSDIKDGFLKSILYSNIERATLDGKKHDVIASIGLTGDDFPEICVSESEVEELDIKDSYKQRLYDIFSECQENGLIGFAAPADLSQEEQEKILRGKL